MSEVLRGSWVSKVMLRTIAPGFFFRSRFIRSSFKIQLRSPSRSEHAPRGPNFGDNTYCTTLNSIPGLDRAAHCTAAAALSGNLCFIIIFHSDFFLVNINGIAGRPAGADVTRRPRRIRFDRVDQRRCVRRVEKHFSGDALSPISALFTYGVFLPKIPLFF